MRNAGIFPNMHVDCLDWLTPPKEGGFVASLAVEVNNLHTANKMIEEGVVIGYIKYTDTCCETDNAE